jgi:pyruvate formate lyase activating enzyme
MRNQKGQVFNIQRFSLHDGPGIRTVVFFKGCPLRCIWCHNPESHESGPEISYYSEKCIRCGACAAVCPQKAHSISRETGEHLFLRENCRGCCGSCAEACPPGALSLIGRTVEAAEALDEVERDEPFYRNSGGGMTLSGGEPFFQSEFALALLTLARERGIHSCVETSGAAAPETLLEAAKLTDIFLYDLKETDPARHREFTGGELEPILQNLQTLDRAGARTILRCPVIPGCNDREDHFRGIACLANRLKNCDHIDMEPYHPLGLSKAAGIGKQVQFQDPAIPPREQAEAWAETLRKHTALPVVLL